MTKQKKRVKLKYVLSRAGFMHKQNKQLLRAPASDGTPNQQKKKKNME